MTVVWRGILRLDGGDVDDSAAAGLRDHLARGGLRAEEDAAQVRVHQRVPLLDCHLQHGGEWIDARVVDERIDAPEGCDRMSDQAHSGVGIAQIALVGGRLTAGRGDRRNDGLRSRRAAVVMDDDTCACLGEAQRDATPNPLPPPVTMTTFSERSSSEAHWRRRELSCSVIVAFVRHASPSSRVSVRINVGALRIGRDQRLAVAQLEVGLLVRRGHRRAHQREAVGATCRQRGATPARRHAGRPSARARPPRDPSPAARPHHARRDRAAASRPAAPGRSGRPRRSAGDAAPRNGRREEVIDRAASTRVDHHSAPAASRRPASRPRDRSTR